jgi:hypothetical protein
MAEQVERIAVLEAKVELYQKDLREIKTIITDHMEEEDARWEIIQNHMAKQKGFIGGIVLVVSSIWAIVLAALQFIKH